MYNIPKQNQNLNQSESNKDLDWHLLIIQYYIMLGKLKIDMHQEAEQILILTEILIKCHFNN